MNARRRELIDELDFAHTEAARLSQSLVALNAMVTPDLTEIFVVRQSWQFASDRTTELANELRSITSSVEEEEAC